MTKICPYCHSENIQPDAKYCSSCGSSLYGAQESQGVQTSTSQGMAGSSTRMQPQSYPPSTFGAPYSSGTSERYERALKRTEQLATAIAGLSVIAIILTLL